MLLSNFNLLATAPGGVARLRELILTLAVQGKLVPQDPSDEPASDLLKRVASSSTVRTAKTLKANGGSDEMTAPYELPVGWTWSRLGDLVENMGSGWSPACDEGERSDPTRWAVLRTTAVQVNEYRAREHKVIPSKLSPRPEIEVKDGDILITRAGPMNRVGISCWVNSTPPRLMLSDKIVRFHSIADEMLPAFIVLTLNAGWTKSQIEEAKTGMAASQVNISQTDLRGFWLPVCSKGEQSRIVTRVEELMRVCDALEDKGKLEAAQHIQLVSTLLGTLTGSDTPEALADSWQRIAAHFDLLLDRPQAIDAFEQTILQLAVRGLLVPQDPSDEPASVLLKEIRAEKDRLIAEGKIKRDKPLAEIAEEEKPFELPVGWEWVRLNALLKKIGAGSTPLGGREVYTPSGVKFLRSQNVYDDGLRLHGVAFIRPETHAKMAGTVVFPNDLLFNITGASIGRCAVVPDDFDEANVSQHVTIVRPVLAALNAFLHKVLVSRHVQKAVMDVQVGVSREGLSITKLGQFLIPVPPLAEQSRIVARVEELRRLCAELRQRLFASQTTQGHLAEALLESVAG